MANRDTPHGFIPYRHVQGGVIRAEKFNLASGYGTSLFAGDAVILSSGKIAVAAQDSAAILGIVAGFKWRNSSGEAQFTPNWVASTATLGSEDVECYVYVDRGISFRVQSETGSTYAKASHDGGAYDIELDHAGSAITGRSGMEIDLTDTGTGQFRVIGLIDEPGNEVGVNAKLEVVMNTPLYT